MSRAAACHRVTGVWLYGIQRTCNFGFQKEEIKTHFLKTKEETCKKKQKYKSQELEIFCKRWLMRERMKDRQYKFYLLQSASGLQKRSEATGLKRWEVSHCDKCAAIITQQPWVLNWVISTTSSCQLEISTVWMNLWTHQQLLEPVLTMLIDVSTFSTAAS